MYNTFKLKKFLKVNFKNMSLTNDEKIDLCNMDESDNEKIKKCIEKIKNINE